MSRSERVMKILWRWNVYLEQGYNLDTMIDLKLPQYSWQILFAITLCILIITLTECDQTIPCECSKCIIVSKFQHMVTRH